MAAAAPPLPWPPAELEAELARAPRATYLQRVPSSWSPQTGQPLERPYDRGAVLASPLSWCALALQSQSVAVSRVLKELCASSRIGCCVGVVRAAIEGQAAHGLASDTDISPVPPPTVAKNVRLLLRCCVRQCAQDDGGPSLEAARCIVCALSGRLSLGGGRAASVLAILREGLALDVGAAARRSGLVFFEPVRRLCLLTAARDAELGGALDGLATSRPEACEWPEPLLQCLDIMAAADTGAQEFRPLPPSVVEEILCPTRCYHGCKLAATAAHASDCRGGGEGGEPRDGAHGRAGAGGVRDDDGRWHGAVHSGLHALLSARLAPLLSAAPDGALPPPCEHTAVAGGVAAAKATGASRYPWAPAEEYLLCPPVVGAMRTAAERWELSLAPASPLSKLDGAAGDVGGAVRDSARGAARLAAHLVALAAPPGAAQETAQEAAQEAASLQSAYWLIKATDGDGGEVACAAVALVCAARNSVDWLSSAALPTDAAARSGPSSDRVPALGTAASAPLRGEAASALLRAVLGSLQPGARDPILSWVAWRACAEAVHAACWHDPFAPALWPLVRRPLAATELEATVLCEMWPRLERAVRSPPAAYSPVMDAVLRRAAGLRAQAFHPSGAAEGVATGAMVAGGVAASGGGVGRGVAVWGGSATGGAPTRKRARVADGSCNVHGAMALSLSDARTLLRVSAYYLPAVLPLLAPDDALALLHAAACSTLRMARRASATTDGHAEATTDLTAQLMAAMCSADKAMTGFAVVLIGLWYGSQPPTHTTRADTHADALSAAGADLTLCASSSATLQRLYLPQGVPPSELADRATVLLGLLRAWLAHAASCEVGRMAATRASRLETVLRSHLREALAARVEAIGTIERLSPGVASALKDLASN